MTGILQQVESVLKFMEDAKGKPYSEDTSTNPSTHQEMRFGPSEYDCSGLVYAALKKAGVDIPASDAIANTEAEWLASQSGAQVIKDVSKIKTGDFVFFTGASPDPSKFGGIGHVGMAISNSQYVSAYDTQEGVTTKPIGGGDGFTVAVRLTKDPVSGGGSGSPQGGGSGGIGIDWGSLPNDFKSFDDLMTKLMWLASPSSWVRIVSFLAGLGLILFAVHAFIAAGNGEPLVKMPPVIPVPV